MANFQYRMQSILNIKLKMEEQAKMQFAQAQAKLNEEEARLHALVIRKEQYEGELKETLQKKLDEDEENGIVLVRELMLSLARENKNLERTTDTYTLSFKKVNVKVKLICDDALRSLMTGRFFLSKNMQISDLKD